MVDRKKFFKEQLGWCSRAFLIFVIVNILLVLAIYSIQPKETALNTFEIHAPPDLEPIPFLSNHLTINKFDTNAKIGDNSVFVLQGNRAAILFSLKDNDRECFSWKIAVFKTLNSSSHIWSKDKATIISLNPSHDFDCFGPLLSKRIKCSEEGKEEKVKLFSFYKEKNINTSRAFLSEFSLSEIPTTDNKMNIVFDSGQYNILRDINFSQRYKDVSLSDTLLTDGENVYLYLSNSQRDSQGRTIEIFTIGEGCSCASQCIVPNDAFRNDLNKFEWSNNTQNNHYFFATKPLMITQQENRKNVSYIISLVSHRELGVPDDDESFLNCLGRTEKDQSFLWIVPVNVESSDTQNQLRNNILQPICISRATLEQYDGKTFPWFTFRPESKKTQFVYTQIHHFDPSPNTPDRVFKITNGRNYRDMTDRRTGPYSNLFYDDEIFSYTYIVDSKRRMTYLLRFIRSQPIIESQLYIGPSRGISEKIPSMNPLRAELFEPEGGMWDGVNRDNPSLLTSGEEYSKAFGTFIDYQIDENIDHVYGIGKVKGGPGNNIDEYKFFLYSFNSAEPMKPTPNFIPNAIVWSILILTIGYVYNNATKSYAGQENAEKQKKTKR